MQNTSLTMTQSETNQHGYQTVPPDYTGIYAFCGTIFILAILLYIVIWKISEKWRVDSYKLRQEAIKHVSKEYKDLMSSFTEIKELLEKLKNDTTK